MSINKMPKQLPSSFVQDDDTEEEIPDYIGIAEREKARLRIDHIVESSQVVTGTIRAFMDTIDTRLIGTGIAIIAVIVWLQTNYYLFMRPPSAILSHTQTRL